MNKIVVIINLLVKNLFMLFFLLFLKNLNQVIKLQNLKLVIESKLLTIRKKLLSKLYTEKWPKEIFMIDSLFKTNPWVYKRLKRKN